MVHHGEVSDPIELTSENRHFFINNEQLGRYDLVRQGTALIVTLLRLHDEANRPDFEYSGGQRALFTTQRQLAFFDTAGKFYDRLFLECLEPSEDSGHPGIRHHATFGTLDGEQTIAIKAEHIHCLGLAAPADVRQRELSLPEL